MKEPAAEWFRKAENDVGTARREAAVAIGANWDAVCFHVQQAIEKYLKGFLQHIEMEFPRTHDLNILLNLMTHKIPEFDALTMDFEFISAFAVEFRYPGEDARQEDAEYALQILEKALSVFRAKLAEIKP
jgi:HEPN domain-containing protein